MKKQKFTGKLSLNKETISKLQDGQMGYVLGGTGSMTTQTCGGCPLPPDPPQLPPISETCVSCQATMCNCTWGTCG